MSSHPIPKLPKALPISKVFASCSTTYFQFKTTNDLKSSYDIIAQTRAVDAINLGLGIKKPGYNIYVAGISGTGKTSVIRTFLEKWSKRTEAPSDWIYVYNFSDYKYPQAIELPRGHGAQLKKLMEQAIKELRQDIPQTLQSEDYDTTINQKLSQINEAQTKKYNELEKQAQNMGFHVKSSKLGIETIPMIDGKILTDKEYMKLPGKEKHRIEEMRNKIEPEVLKFARKVRALDLEAKSYIDRLQKALVKKVIDNTFEDLFEEFGKHPQVNQYLKQVVEHILENLLDFVEPEDLPQSEEQSSDAEERKEKLKVYSINLLVNNAKTKCAPVVIETNPTYYNLFGKVEKNVDHGVLHTDFTMIHAGTIHKANGGYLMLEASDIFKQPMVWETLKKVLRNQKAFIEDIGEQYAMLSTTALKPEPIDLDLKVILIGSDEVYHLLHEMDEEFSKIFKVKAEFDHQMVRNKQNINAYASFVATRVKREELLPFDPSAVASIVEYGTRLTEDQRYLSTQFSEIKDLTIEADFIARQNNQRIVKRAHVEEALLKKFYRVNLIEMKINQMIESEEIMVSVDGERIGQVNGLSVFDMGDYSFGKIARITCTSSVNKKGIINVEKDAKLSGNIHNKGVLILTGFLNALLAKERALGLSASLCFEQSYGLIDGDSASIAELIAIISSMAEIPVRQNVAMTGSLNQLGDIQPIGGVNEKIEGFYRICKILGKGSSYTVLIPYQNVVNLMLASDVRDAVKSGYLKIIPVKSFWQAFEIVTNVSFGAKTIYDKTFKKDSAVARIMAKLTTLKL